MSNPLLVNPTAFEANLLSALAAQTSDVDDRKLAFESFARTGLPHRRMEAWKWTDFRTALNKDAPKADSAHLLTPSLFSGIGAFTITLDEQGPHWGDNVPNGMTLRLTDDVPKLMDIVGDHPMANLAAALCGQTLIITVSEDAIIHAPIHLRRAVTGAPSHMRVLISVDRGGSLKLIESIEFDKGGVDFDNLLTELRLGENASFNRTVYCNSGDDGVDMSLLAAELQAEAQFDQYVLLSGGQKARFETCLHFKGEEARAKMMSAALLGNKRHGDLTSHIVHEAAGCITEQQHKTVLKDQAMGVFQGKFLVEREGQKTDANMQANAMLLSDQATINHKPELEIYADDVLCAHGSTSGALDEEAIFYLRQRGLTQVAARSLLVEAFVGEVFDEIDDEDIAALFRQQTLTWLFSEKSDSLGKQSE